MGIGKTALIKAADTDVTPVKKNYTCIKIQMIPHSAITICREFLKIVSLLFIFSTISITSVENGLKTSYLPQLMGLYSMYRTSLTSIILNSSARNTSKFMALTQ